MYSYKELLDANNIKPRCKNADELRKWVYNELQSPVFNLYRSSSACMPSSSTNLDGSGTVMDFSTSRLLESQCYSLSKQHTGHILSDDQRKSFKGLILVAQNMIQNKKLKEKNLIASVAKIPNLPLEVLWWYHSSEIMPIVVFIAQNLSNTAELQRLGNGLSELMMSSSGEGMEGAIVIDLLTALCRMVFGPDPHDSLKDARKACNIIFQSIIRKQLAAIKVETGTLWWLQKLVEPTNAMPSFLTKQFAMMLLRLMLTEPPYISVHQALARQTEWTFNLAPKILTLFFINVFKAIHPSSVILDILITVLKGNYEVSWKAVLICLSTYLKIIPDAANVLSELISKSISQAFAENNRELLLTAFLIARQCSAEGSAAGCPTYPVWFKKTFGSRSTSLATTLSHWRFLLDFLTQMVPHEPAACLKAHIDQPPACPTAFRHQLQDYVALASTRLRDLGYGATEKIIGLFHMDNGPAKSLEEQAQYDVEKAISYFESNEKVHKSIYEGSMFKKKYFEQHFLPTLLKPRVLPSANDPQTLLIDKLLNAGKISPQQHENYHVQCLAAASNSKLNEPEAMVL